MINLHLEIPSACFGNAVGVASPSIIPDNQMTASTYLMYINSPHYGRLNDIRGDAWCAQSSSGAQDWLQVDLGKTVEICGVATQGNIKDPKYWVTKFKLAYSSDGGGWNTYRDTHGMEVVSGVKTFRRGKGGGGGFFPRRI